MMSVAPEDILPSFDSNARKYRCCCCGCCWHIRICAKIIGTVESVCISIAFVASLIGYVHHRSGKALPPPMPTGASPRPDRYPWFNGTLGGPGGGGGPPPPFGDRNGTMMVPPLPPYPSILPTNPDVLFAIYAFFFVVVWMVVILLFFGISRIKPRCLLPHVFVQALCVLYTVVMAVVYALQSKQWSILTFPTRPALIVYSLGSILEIFTLVCIIRCYQYLKAKRRAAPVCRFEKPMEEMGAGYPV